MLKISKLSFLHTHYIPVEFSELDCLEALLVPEFYPELMYDYYGEIVYFSSFIESIEWIAQHLHNNANIRFAIENNHLIKSAAELYELKDLGVVSIQLFHHMSNAFFDIKNGLSKEGKRLLYAIRELDMYLDLSHLNDEQTKEVLKQYNGKTMVSHCACSDILRNKKNSNNLSLHTLNEICCNEDGLIGIPFVNSIVSEENESLDTIIIDDICRQIAYLVERIGEDHIALGPDFFSTRHYSNVYQTNIVIPDILKSVCGIQLLADNLINRGISENAIEKVFFLNVKKKIMS